MATRVVMIGRGCGRVVSKPRTRHGFQGRLGSHPAGLAQALRTAEPVASTAPAKSTQAVKVAACSKEAATAESATAESTAAESTAAVPLTCSRRWS